MIQRQPLVTADDLMTMSLPDGRSELVNGELRLMSPAGGEHGAIAMAISLSLAAFVKQQRLGRVFAAETGFRLRTNPDTVRAPDVAFIHQERLSGKELPKTYWEGAPDLAVEVISPHDLYADVQEKALDWLTAGTLAVIVIDPRKRVATVYRTLQNIIVLTENDSLELPDVVPGWSMTVKEMFE